MSWHFVERWLEKASQHATLVGKFWLTFLIVCRMVIIASIGDRVYADEQSEFKCNTQQPGCNNVCFNSFSPISHLRFWSFQILACAMPSIIFVIYSGHKAREKSKLESEAKKRQKERAQRHQDRGPTQASAPYSTSAAQPSQTPKRQSTWPKKDKRTRVKQHIHTAPLTHRDPEITKIIKKPNRHFRLYVVSTFVRLNLEFGFLYLQWHLFGFEVPSTYKCKQNPCPNVVDCFPSRPQEKTIFLYFMFLFSILCCVLNVCEFLELVWKLLKRCDCRRLNCCGCQKKYQRPSEPSRQYLQAGPPPAPFIFDGPSVSRLEGNYEDNHFDNRPLLGEKRNRFVKRSASGMKSPTSSTAHDKQQDKGQRITPNKQWKHWKGKESEPQASNEKATNWL
ncbi:unnamed protein product [Oikopleura dioica]|uniref:Gap junction protein n=1 Tax=Oikopleura dioica TaxID=34765 RepID=E4WRX0_OIKDI|nr:unnamed protein product [Oikopleura dioica]